MKNSFLTILTLCIITSLNAQSVTDGLIGYWTFNGDANDQSGNNYNGSINGVLSTVDRNGNSESAYAFENNMNQRIDIASSLQISTDAWAIGLWIKPRANPNTLHYALSFDNNNVGLYVPGGIGANYSDTFGFYNGSSVVISATGFSTDSYYFIVLQYNNSNWEMYINGELVATAQLNYSIPASKVMLGIRGDSYWPLNGDIDDLLIFNRSLNAEEVTQLYTDNIELPDSGCSNIFCDGQNVGIGTSDTKGYKLAVAGKTITEEVKIALIENWPDYVLDKEYELRTLEEVENYIVEKGHLPEIPNEQEVVENGINLGDMNAKFLQKIEELTLYLIEQNKLNQAQQAEIQELREEIKLLKDQ